MKSITKYVSVSVLTLFLVSTLSSCWVVVPHSSRVHVKTKKDNGLHKGWYKHPKHKKYYHKNHHKGGHHFAPNGKLNNGQIQTIEFRVDQPE